MKDLLDILRDRRTLIAMIVVPIVLYPALMLGSIQAASLQRDQIKEQALVIAVQTTNVADWLEHLLLEDARRVDEQVARAEAQGAKPPGGEPVRHFGVVSLQDGLDATEWVRRGNGDCAVIFDSDDLPVPRRVDDLKARKPKVVFDSAEIRSAMAGRRVMQALERSGWYILEQRNELAGMPHAYIAPMMVREVDVASAEKRGGFMLGQIIPIILILMTMTSAIYPAIDLTAGERERGTLETLMVCPIPVVEIMAGKFLVVATISLIGAILNLSSMGLTLHFGGFHEALSMGADTVIPLAVLPLILLFLVPLAVFFSALMLAVCSFARTFKEAQNYITPVIISVLVPAGLAALPGSELQGTMMVLPVANMVLLTREMLLGNADAGVIIAVLLSTCLYAATAVAVAVRVFGQEAVLFADSGSWRAQFDRHMIRPSANPRPTLTLMYVALLFPIWFYLLHGVNLSGDHFRRSLTVIQLLMIMCFALIPMILIVYYKVDLRNGFGLHLPRPRHVLAALLLGCGTWAMASEVTLFLKTFALFGLTDEWLEQVAGFSRQVMTLSPVMAVVLLAVVPGVCEELLFRGMLLNGLRHAFRKWTVLIVVGLVFAAYHYLIQRFVVTFCMGLLLAYVTWQARSIVPAMIAHIMHNGMHILLVLPATAGPLNDMLGIPEVADVSLVHLPLHVVLAAGACVVLALALCRKAKSPPAPSPSAEYDAKLQTAG